MIRACLILLCLLLGAAILSTWVAAPIVRGPTPFDVAYARFLDGQAAAGELSASEERFHRFAAKGFQKGPWRERLSEPAWQLRVTAQGYALNVAYVNYAPEAVREQASNSSFEWQHFHYDARTSSHGRYLVLRVPIWPPLAATLLYPAVRLVLWRRVRWFWRGIARTWASTWQTARVCGIGWCAIIAPGLLV